MSLSPFTKEQLLPQPEMLEIKKQKGELFIGLPKETHFEEKRISLTPDAVAALVAHGHRVVVETGAGEGANYFDREYSEAGAKISYDIKEVFGCNLLVKVEPPSLDEIKLMNPQAFLISALQLKTQDKQYFKALAKKSHEIHFITYTYNDVLCRIIYNPKKTIGIISFLSKKKKGKAAYNTNMEVQKN